MNKVTYEMMERMNEIYIQGNGIKLISKEFKLSKTLDRVCLVKSGVKFRSSAKDVTSSFKNKKFIKLYINSIS